MYTDRTYAANISRLRYLLNVGEIDNFAYTEAVKAEQKRLMRYCKESLYDDDVQRFFDIIVSEN